MGEDAMVQQPSRGEREGRLVAALRGTFDGSVMNFGSYNILYAGTAHTGRVRSADDEPQAASVQESVSLAEHLLVGYRRQPAEMVLCPVDIAEALSRAVGDGEDAASGARPSVPLPVNMTNLAGMAADGQQVEIALSTGHRVVLDVRPQVSFDDLPGVTLHQRADVADFYDFVDFFMDRLEEMNPV